MVVAMMGGDEKKRTFHDFLGMNCGESAPSAAAWARSGEKMPAAEAAPEASVGVSSVGHGLVSGSSDLGSERKGGNNSEDFHFHGRKNAMSGLEICNTSSGRKRSNSDSAYMGFVRNRMLPVGSDSLESSRLMKAPQAHTPMSGKEVGSEGLGRSHDEMMISMQPPRPTSLILHPPLRSRPDSLIPKWERSMPPNPGQMVHFPLRFAQGGTNIDKVSSSYAYKDASAGATIISQTVADEGSRTGIKDSGIVNIINPGSGAGERNSTGALPGGNRPKVPQAIEPESCTIPRCQSTVSASRQMTIFYAGQAHVFDDVHPIKADVIMALAGSNGGSWSTTYSPKSSIRPPTSEAKTPSGENKMRMNNLPLSIHGDSDHGLSQVAQIPVLNVLSSLMPGSNQGSMSVRDARLTPPASEHNVEDRRDA
ncbi:protein TIFY 8 isoform X2 [Phoenix dactylifera]|uniref:Protein TIFY n=1 Tax=Phoenix dactylifera TaxID=42345 RepID=A0A8B8ZL88_PHODC|nr:protein TIFY 8 isoform X2 [Phoenix dactylifera]XP_038974980.1 protein TIFY 8 isoform X2 [Phoenix dactylifera]